jgi:hypothetical protein
MVTSLEEDVRDFYSQGVPIKELSKITGGSVSTVKNYAFAFRAGYSSWREYLDERAQKHGFDDNEAYKNDLLKRKGFTSLSRYKKADPETKNKLRLNVKK